MQRWEDNETILKASAEEMAAIARTVKKNHLRSFVLRKIVLVAVALVLTLTVGFIYYRFDSRVPSNINIVAGQEQSISLGVPASGEIISVSSKGKTTSQKLSGSVNLNRALTMKMPAESSCSLQVRLFGIIPMKKVGVKSIDSIRLLPAGVPIGLYIETEGILVVGTGTFSDKDGVTVAPAENILYSGDYIRTVDGMAVENKQDFVACVKAGCGKEMELGILRGEQEMTVRISPAQDNSGDYKAGIWVKDDAQGVGTLTYIDENGYFGALGHGITDVDSRSIMSLHTGTLFDSKIVSIKKGAAGDPGEMTGTIIYGSNHVIGEINENSERGIYGKYTGDISAVSKNSPMEIGLKQEIVKGPAQILCTVEKEPDYYDVEITAIHLEYDRVNRGIELKVTDERLLEATGGIVQGMSGSPIIQNGKFIGAVTHVLVNDPTKGYGIFIENMLQ